MANCNDSSCKNKLISLHDARVAERASWDRLMFALKLAGFTAGATVAIICVWLGKKLAEATAAAAFPGIGWVFAGITLVLLSTALGLWIVWKVDKSKLEDEIDLMQGACDSECWPPYAK